MTILRASRSKPCLFKPLLHHRASYSIQHAIQKCNALWSSIAATDLQCLIDHDRMRCRWKTQHLSYRHSQQVTIYDRHTLQPPVLRMLFDQRVDLLAALRSDTEEIVGKSLRLRIDRRLRRTLHHFAIRALHRRLHISLTGVPEETAYICRLLFSQIGLKQHL